MLYSRLRRAYATTLTRFHALGLINQRDGTRLIVQQLEMPPRAFGPSLGNNLQARCCSSFRA
jgi:hypothetical protein